VAGSSKRELNAQGVEHVDWPERVTWLDWTGVLLLYVGLGVVVFVTKFWMIIEWKVRSGEWSLF